MRDNNSKGKVIFVMGTTGSGKGTLNSILKERHPEFLYIPSVTTRSIREGEVEGNNYNFIRESEFKQLIAEDKLLEYALVHNKAYYGTLKEEIFNSLRDNKIIVKELDYQGLMQAKKILSKDQMISIFIMPPSFDVLKERIKLRAKISDEEVELRINSAREELNHLNLYDVKLEVIDGDIEQSYELFEKEILKNI
ncbi:MAG: guanylate kinase [Candidatus Woesearchaeota archaeon]|jgi:guanylate kinase|nr:guanylate kinase [Candidatus Woesearchaeota archaeon]